MKLKLVVVGTQSFTLEQRVDCHALKNNNRNRSKTEFKKLRYERRLIYINNLAKI